MISGGKLVGAIGLSQPRGPLPCDVYLMADFGVRPTPHRRLSKLILACMLSREVLAHHQAYSFVDKLRYLAII